jgi:hypothetical protein
MPLLFLLSFFSRKQENRLPSKIKLLTKKKFKSIEKWKKIFFCRFFIGDYWGL